MTSHLDNSVAMLTVLYTSLTVLVIQPIIFDVNLSHIIIYLMHTLEHHCRMGALQTFFYLLLYYIISGHMGEEYAVVHSMDMYVFSRLISKSLVPIPRSAILLYLPLGETIFNGAISQQ